MTYMNFLKYFYLTKTFVLLVLYCSPLAFIVADAVFRNV